jgi:hypothetical protein
VTGIRTDDLVGRYERAAAQLLAAGERFEAELVSLISELVHRVQPAAARLDLHVALGAEGDVYAVAGVLDAGGQPLAVEALAGVRVVLDQMLADLASVAGADLDTLVLDPPAGAGPTSHGG